MLQGTPETFYVSTCHRGSAPLNTALDSTMRFSNSPTAAWHRHGLAILTFAVVMLLAAHPELRLLIPLVDAMGLDVLLLLCGAQALASSHAISRLCVLPLLRRLYGGLLFFLGIAGPSFDAIVRQKLVPRLSRGAAV